MFSQSYAFYSFHYDTSETTQQEMLVVIAYVDQSIINRYLVFADPLLTKILPTAENVESAIQKEYTLDDFKKNYSQKKRQRDVS